LDLIKLEGRQMACNRAWLIEAVRRIEADFNRSSDTHLLHHPIDGFEGIDLYFKDESSHPTGSLKHRLARSLFLYALCNEKIGPQTTLIEASSGSTAVSEAYFAKLLGLDFIAVVPRHLSPAKVEAIGFYGGRVHYVDEPSAVYETAQRLADETKGYYLDQFTYAERATDWRGNNNIADSLFCQMALEPHPVPTWIVMGGGTGGTTATLGRYIRYRGLTTKLCLADPVTSIFHQHWRDPHIIASPNCQTSVIEGIGRPRVEPSFLPHLIDRVEAISDAQSVAAMHTLSQRLGRRVGGSTGTRFWAVMLIMLEMRERGEKGSIVTILCDGGDRYATSLYDDAYLKAKGVDWVKEHKALSDMLGSK